MHLKCYYPNLYAFVLSRTANEDLTRDILQELFFRVWEKRASLSSFKSIKSYLFTIANHLLIDHYRKKKSEYSYLNHINLQIDEAYQIDHAQQIDFRTALEKMPELVREAFLLNRTDGLTYAEIAEVYDVSPKTIGYRIGQALLILRKYLR